MRFRQHTLPDPVRRLTVGPGEKVLAGCVGEAGEIVAGTRDALYVEALGDTTQRIPWEQVEKADWDREAATLGVTLVGTWGAPQTVHRFSLAEPGRLLELIRERVTASLVLQRHVPVHGRRGLFVIARRAPRGDQPLIWVYQFEEGIDPADPEVRRLAAIGLARAQEETGLAGP